MTETRAPQHVSDSHDALQDRARIPLSSSGAQMELLCQPGGKQSLDGVSLLLVDLALAWGARHCENWAYSHTHHHMTSMAIVLG
jgi:hypothetical protein